MPRLNRHQVFHVCFAIKMRYIVKVSALAVPVFVPTRISVCAAHTPGGSVWPVVPGHHAG